MSVYKKGQYNCVCEQCGFEYKSDEMQERYDGLFVCKEACWEPRHSLEFAIVVRDEQRVSRPAPEPTDIFISVNYYEPVPQDTFVHPSPPPAAPTPTPPSEVSERKLDYSIPLNVIYKFVLGL